jgi:hypothetical protein
MIVQADVQGSAINANVNIYLAAGTSISDLQFLTCTTVNGVSNFHVAANQTYYLQAGSAFGELGKVQINLQQIPPPANDDFAKATTITSLPFDDTVDTSAASLEASEPTPSCASNGLFNTVWYAFTPNTSGSISLRNPSNSFSPVVAAYTGSSLTSLTEVRCQTDGFPLTFVVEAGTTYYFQAGGLFDSGHGGPMQFHMEVTPPPVAGLSFNPSEPSIFDTIGFCDSSSDPGEAGFQSFAWDFGDQTTTIATDGCLFHQYAADGDYTVQHSVTTLDGRTASTSQIIHVRTHDVSITKITTPKSARSGQTKTIAVSIRNTRYPEMVTVDLYKSTLGGEIWIGSLTLQVPVLSGNKTKQFVFHYTFTAQDAQMGKVTFRAVATINGANDAIPADNQAISIPATIVKW